MEVASQETDLAARLEAYVASVVSLAQPLRIRVYTGPNEAAHQAPADIALKLHQESTGQTTAADVLLDDSSTPRLIAPGLPWNDVRVGLIRLVKAYQVERCGRDTFGTWVRSLPDEAVRERLGVQPAAESTRA